MTDEQKALRDVAHDFAEKEIRPREREYDEHATHPADVVAKAHELGLMNVHIPEAYGGLELGAFEGMIIGEELCWGCSGIGTAIAANGLGHGPVIMAGTEEQKRRWLSPLIDEVLLTSFALTEPNAGSDVSGIQTTAVRDGDDYILNGSKMFITNAGHAAWFTVFASTDKSQGHRGLTAFVVPADADGVVVDKHLDKMGQRSTDTSALSFQDVRVPAANRLGEEGEGFKIAMSALDNGRYTVAAGATGLIQASLEASVKYAQERQTFGVPIAEHQLVKRMISHMVRKLDTSRLLVYRAGWMKNKGRRNTRETTLAKWHATVSSFEAADDAIQVHGAYGYSDEYPVERYLRNARGAIVYEGTRELQGLLQADFAFGFRENRPLRKELPGYDAGEWE